MRSRRVCFRPPCAFTRVCCRYDGEHGTNSEACIRFLLRVIRGRPATSATTMLKQTLALLLYRPRPPPTPASDLAPADASTGLTSVAVSGPLLSEPARILVLGGDADALVGASSMRDTARRLGADLVVVPGAGHNVFVQNSRRVNEALLKHWRVGGEASAVAGGLQQATTGPAGGAGGAGSSPGQKLIW